MMIKLRGNKLLTVETSWQ